MKFELLLKKVENDILSLGNLQPVPRYAPKEILNYNYSYNSELVINVTDKELVYVNNKLLDYKVNLEDVLNKLRWNKSSRQAVIQFDQSGLLPNCTTSIQFQIRSNELFVTVFQRSQDIDKMQMDCEIFNRFAKSICDFFSLQKFNVNVLVGNMHKFIHNVE